MGVRPGDAATVGWLAGGVLAGAGLVVEGLVTLVGEEVEEDEELVSIASAPGAPVGGTLVGGRSSRESWNSLRSSTAWGSGLHGHEAVVMVSVETAEGELGIAGTEWSFLLVVAGAIVGRRLRPREEERRVIGVLVTGALSGGAEVGWRRVGERPRGAGGGEEVGGAGEGAVEAPPKEETEAVAALSAATARRRASSAAAGNMVMTVGLKGAAIKRRGRESNRKGSEMEFVRGEPE